MYIILKPDIKIINAFLFISQHYSRVGRYRTDQYAIIIVWPKRILMNKIACPLSCVCDKIFNVILFVCSFVLDTPSLLWKCERGAVARPRYRRSKSIFVYLFIYMCREKEIRLHNNLCVCCVLCIAHWTRWSSWCNEITRNSARKS